MGKAYLKESEIIFTRKGETICITPCGEECIRVRISPQGQISDENLTLEQKSAAARTYKEQGVSVLTCGKLSAKIYDSGKLVFCYDGKTIIEEKPTLAFDSGYRCFKHRSGNLWSAQITFCAHEDEHFYGLGHEATGRFDLKGCTIDLRNVNAKCAIPFVFSSLGYGFLWNSASTGQCSLAYNHTRWQSDAMRQMDFVVIGGTARTVLSRLADLTGHAPMLPEWAAGFWQSRLRYETQEELLSVARRYKEEGIELSVIVADYFHWTEQGDYKFDSKYWPDVRAMADELHSMGIKLMVSVWPTINENSENYRTMDEENMLVRTARGINHVFPFYGPQSLIDVTNARTRDFVWNKLKENYIDYGVDGFWLDEAEPEFHPVQFDNLLFHLGAGDEVGLLYPYYYAKMVYDGMKSIGREDIVTLTRCAYLGSQKFGALVWSGDIPSTFESLSDQVKSSLNMAMCSIPWWTTDIGGFYGGDTRTDYFRELIIRWFQYGVFCPITRLHGVRAKTKESRDIIEPTGGDNEIWSFGDEAAATLKKLISLRCALRPYVLKHMRIASEIGCPVIRPMFFDFPDEEVCYSLGGQYMFGSDILFAPITQQGQTEKEVYLPKGRWVFTRDKKIYEGGKSYLMHAETDEFIAFTAEGAEILGVF
ncbi:MAG: glycoside hydrolase family 31 protein [Clostridia bacterium]|nr:glycoside hydrolase family 31 protein [Clostridia bacterium]